MADQTTSTPPQSFGVLLYPGFEALDAFGPLDAFNILSWTHPISLSILAKTLEPVSTVVPNSPSPKFAQSVVPTHTLTDPPALDVLLVPGGMGVRAGVEAEIEFIRTVFPRLRYLITVCTGSDLAALAGVLDGRRATTNKSAFKDVAARSPQVNWVKKARWVVDGNVWTSAGVSAGLDVAFAWIAEVWGKDVAGEIADGMEYDRHLDPSWDPYARLYGLVEEGKGEEEKEAK